MSSSRIHTFSIVAYDPAEDAFGVGVASKFLAVGAVVPWARAGVGAIATQAWGKISFGPDGLALLAEGLGARATLDRLLAADVGREHRQVGIVDARGEAAAHTGSECSAFAAHRLGDGFACQGNILAGPQVLTEMADAFTRASGELADRLLAALQAGDAAGGDRRGKQSAAILVARPNAGYGGDNDRYLDLRVDDDPDPMAKMASLVATHHVFFGRTRPEDVIPIGDDMARELQQMMIAQGYLAGEPTGRWDDASIHAFGRFIGAENLEERWDQCCQPNQIDRVALEFLRRRFPAR